MFSKVKLNTNNKLNNMISIGHYGFRMTLHKSLGPFLNYDYDDYERY